MAESLALVPVFAGTINSQPAQLCDARALHTFMGVLRDFSDWIKGRIKKFGFAEGVDYLLAKSGEQVFAKSGENFDSPNLGNQKRGGDRRSIDYHLTLDMAKELAMVENNVKGREARRYFIDCEKRALELLAAPAAHAHPTTPRTAAVQFHGATLFVIEHGSQPITSLKSIAQAIGLPWEGLAWTVAGNEARWGLVDLPHRGDGGEQSLLCMPIRKVGAWLATIETGKIKDRAVRAQAIRYQNECDDVLWKCWSEVAGTGTVVAAPQVEQMTAVPDSQRTASAFMAAQGVAMQIQKSVFNAVLAGGDDWKHQRWLVSFITDSREATPAWVDKLGADAFIGNGYELADALRRGAFQREELLDINEALAHRIYIHSCNDGVNGIGAQVTPLLNRDLPMTDLREIATCAMLELWGRAAAAKENPAIAA